MEKIVKAIQTFFQKNKKAKKAAVILCVLLLAGSLISRGIYTAVLPRVGTERPVYRNLEHQVFGEGRLVANKEVSVYGEDGLRVAYILVKEGQEVEPGTPLLQYDLEDLGELIEEVRLEEERLNIQIETLEYNQGLSQKERDKGRARAAEDYQNTQQENASDAARAQETIAKAQNELDSYPTWETYLADYLKAHQKTVSGNTLSEIDRALLEKTAREEWEQGRQILIDQVLAKQEAADNISGQNGESLKQAKRALEDALANSPKDSSLSLLRLEREVVSKELALYEQIAKEEGIVRAELAGTVTTILIEESGRVADRPLMKIGDRAAGFYFESVIGREERKQVSVGDEAQLTIGADKKRITGEIISIEENGQEGYLLTISPTEDVGSLGEEGEMKVVRQEADRCLTVPLTALRQENGNKFVLVIEERQTILGTEWIAVKRNVQVRSQNSTYAALESGSLSEEDQVITDATKPMGEGDVIRLIEP
ncbi:MAG: hypothetical protein J1E61_07760 [Lachnospiraceae bacterium]|nr:hypothetical protein [Lachnospiraceae bacterium]